MLQWGIDVLVNDLGIVHTLSKHNRHALVNGFQHVYICMEGVNEEKKTYWNHNTAYSINSLLRIDKGYLRGALDLVCQFITMIVVFVYYSYSERLVFFIQ